MFVLGRNFVSSLIFTLDLKKLLKNLKNFKNLKKPKNLKTFSKNLGFFPALVWMDQLFNRLGAFIYLFEFTRSSLTIALWP